MPSILTRMASLVPGFRPTATPPAIVTETPVEARLRTIETEKAKLAASSRRPRPSTEEKVPRDFAGGIASKVWFLPYRDSTTKDTPEIRAAMRLMRRDPYVKAAWEPQILAVASESIQVRASESGNREAEEQADATRAMIESIAGGMPQVVRAICAPFGSEGHSLAEPVWHCCPRGKLTNKFTVAALKPKDTNGEAGGMVRLIGDEYGNVTHVEALRKSGQQWPIRDFLYSRYMTVFDEPLGEAAFRPSYGAYWMRDTVRKLRAIHHEKKMAGMLVGKFVNDDDAPTLRTALANAKTATWMVIPDDTKVEAINLSTASEPDYKSFDESLRDEIVTGIAFATLQILMGSSTGGEVRGSSEVQKMISDLGPWLLKAIVEDTINNQLIPDFIDFNYPYPAAGEYPKLSFGAVSNAEILEQQQVVLGAMQTGMAPSLKNYSRDWSVQLADPNDPTDMMKLPTPAAPPVGAPAPGGIGGMPSLAFSERRPVAADIKAALARFASEYAA